MKKTLFCMTLVCFFANTNAQFIEQGSWIANGTLSFYSTKEKDSKDKFTSFGIMPWAGYFVMDNLGIGAMAEFSNSVTKTESSGKFTNTTFLFGPILRYYLVNGLFAQGYFGIGSEKFKNEFGGGSSSESTYNITEFLLGAGYAVRITETVFLDPVIAFKSRKQKDKDNDFEETESGICFMINFTILLK